MAATLKTTGEYRYNVRRNGVLCCRGNDAESLCEACQKQVNGCTCAECKKDKTSSQGQTASASSMRSATARQQISVVKEALNALSERTTTTQGDVPSAPNQVEAIRQSSGATSYVGASKIRDVVSAIRNAIGNPKVLSSGVPEPPSLESAIKGMRATEGGL